METYGRYYGTSIRTAAWSDPIDQPLAHRMEFWRRTGRLRGASVRPRRSPPEGARIGPIAGWGPDHRPLVDGELLLRGQVLEGELAVASEEEGEYPKQVEQERDHRAEIVAGSTTPRVHASGGKTRFGPSRPAVNRYLKWAFVEAANANLSDAGAHGAPPREPSL